MALLHDPDEVKGNSGSLYSVTVAGQKLEITTKGTIQQRADAVDNSDQNAWYYNESINISFIKVFDNSSSISREAQYV